MVRLAIEQRLCCVLLCAAEGFSRGAATSGSLKLKAPEGESRSGSPMRVLGGVKG
jgi:hypothetical protein